MVNYRYNCVTPNSVSELEFILQNGKKISYNTFIKAVNKNEFNIICKYLGYSNDSKEGLHIKDDWAVSFYKSKLPSGQPVYYFVHSAIEYIFY